VGVEIFRHVELLDRLAVALREATAEAAVPHPPIG